MCHLFNNWYSTQSVYCVHKDGPIWWFNGLLMSPVLGSRSNLISVVLSPFYCFEFQQISSKQNKSKSNKLKLWKFLLHLKEEVNARKSAAYASTLYFKCCVSDFNQTHCDFDSFPNDAQHGKIHTEHVPSISNNRIGVTDLRVSFVPNFRSAIIALLHFLYAFEVVSFMEYRRSISLKSKLSYAQTLRHRKHILVNGHTSQFESLRQ